MFGIGEIKKYHRVPKEGATHHTLGLFGRLLGAYSTRASAVITIAVYDGTYQHGVKTVCCLETGDWSIRQLEAVMGEHARQLDTKHFWCHDEPVRQFFRLNTDLREVRSVRSVLTGNDALGDENIRLACAGLESGIDNEFIVLPSKDEKMHPEVAGMVAELKNVDPGNLRSVSLRVLATGLCAAACSRRVTGRLGTYDTNTPGVLNFSFQAPRARIPTPEQYERMARAREADRRAYQRSLFPSR